MLTTSSYCCQLEVIWRHFKYNVQMHSRLTKLRQLVNTELGHHSLTHPLTHSLVRPFFPSFVISEPSLITKSGLESSDVTSCCEVGRLRLQRSFARKPSEVFFATIRHNWHANSYLTGIHFKSKLRVCNFWVR